MDIGSTEGIGGIGRIQGPQKPASISPSSYTQAAGSADKLEISTHGHLVSQARELPAMRLERIQEVRTLIESGRFDTPQRLQGAIDRFLDENPDLKA